MLVDKELNNMLLADPNNHTIEKKLKQLAMRDNEPNSTDLNKKPPIAQNIYAAWNDTDLTEFLEEIRKVPIAEVETKYKFRFIIFLFCKNFDKRLWGPLLSACITCRFYVISEFSKPSYDIIKNKWINLPKDFKAPEIEPVLPIPQLELELRKTGEVIEDNPNDMSSAIIFTCNGIKITHLQLREPRFLFMTLQELHKSEAK